MNTKQANDAFNKLETLIQQLNERIPFDLIEKVYNSAESLRDKMETEIEKLENKGHLNDEQEERLDRFQSTIEAIRNIAEIIEPLKDTVEEFGQVQKYVNEANETI
ncbi:hypothetical protein [Paenibacillus pini]|uniref:Uncharacterized protein n=1 Tax=Paenibacillus pini JCM 16418 TaxID=1236976 RepID=W7Z8Q9_9BACL|nr:hypothetical protein [Paenibacillus pini]GAF10834.1 hypothetical protein JCM16418_5059 [Paenibacillus pini JCM 16418]